MYHVHICTYLLYFIFFQGFDSSSSDLDIADDVDSDSSTDYWESSDYETEDSEVSEDYQSDESDYEAPKKKINLESSVTYNVFRIFDLLIPDHYHHDL